jgi:hypothetical protein
VISFFNKGKSFFRGFAFLCNFVRNRICVLEIEMLVPVVLARYQDITSLISIGNLQFASICDLDTTLLIFEYSSAPLNIINIHFSTHFVQFKIHLLR